MAAAGVADRDQTAFFGYPRALSTLFFVEMWERFSYFGMAAILVLYFTASPDKGGAGLSVPDAAAIYSLYVALVYVSSLPGGWLADRVLGAKKTVLLGGSIIAIGHFVMSHGAFPMVIAGLAIILVGSGMIKPNTTGMVGELYGESDPRRDAGFSVYYMSINLGAFIAPLICGYLAAAISWQAGFLAAAVGMTLGVIHYALDWRGLGTLGAEARRPLGPRPAWAPLLYAGIVVGLVAVGAGFAILRPPLPAVEQVLTIAVVILPLVYFARLLTDRKRPPEERGRLTAFFILFLATAVWFAVIAQAGSTLNVFAQLDTRREILGFDVPAAWFQSINPICILLFAPVVAGLWLRMGPRQPSTPVKFAIALFLVGISMALMMVAGRYAPVEGRATVLVSPLWLVVVYVVQTVGELLISPVGYSVASQLAPKREMHQLLGVWFLALAVGAAISGELAALYDMVGVAPYYAILAILVAGSGAVILLLRPVLLRLMAGVR